VEIKMEINFVLEMEINKYCHILLLLYNYGSYQATNQKEATMQILTPKFVKRAVAIYLLMGGTVNVVPMRRRSL
jgi:hypothetical protein